MLEFTKYRIYYSRSDISFLKKQTPLFIATFCILFPILGHWLIILLLVTSCLFPEVQQTFPPWKINGGFTYSHHSMINLRSCPEFETSQCHLLGTCLGLAMNEVVKGGENVQKLPMKLLRNISWFWSLDCTYCIILYSASSRCN